MPALLTSLLPLRHKRLIYATVLAVEALLFGWGVFSNGFASAIGSAINAASDSTACNARETAGFGLCERAQGSNSACQLDAPIEHASKVSYMIVCLARGKRS